MERTEIRQNRRRHRALNKVELQPEFPGKRTGRPAEAELWISRRRGKTGLTSRRNRCACALIAGAHTDSLTPQFPGGRPELKADEPLRHVSGIELLPPEGSIFALPSSR